MFNFWFWLNKGEVHVDVVMLGLCFVNGKLDSAFLIQLYIILIL